jgi:hypothetical protein
MTRLKRLATSSAFLAALLATSRASADFDITQLAEVLIQTAGADAVNLGGMFGGDASSPLGYTASLDLANKSFSYSTVAGSMYLGLPVSVQTSAVFNGVTGRYDITEMGSLGALSWSSSGAFAVVTGDPSFTLTIPIPFTKVTINVGGGYVKGAAGTSSFGLFNFAQGGKVLIGLSGVDAIVNGVLVALDIKIDADAGGPQFRVHMDGGPIPANGGPFVFTQIITAVPEPGGLTLLGVGATILLGSRRLARPRARPVPTSHQPGSPR